MAVRTIVLSRHGSNLARPVIIHDIIHGLIYVPSTPCCGFFRVSPDGNCPIMNRADVVMQYRELKMNFNSTGLVGLKRDGQMV